MVSEIEPFITDQKLSQKYEKWKDKWKSTILEYAEVF